MRENETATQSLSEHQGMALVSLARHTIMERLGGHPDPVQVQRIEEILQDSALRVHSGTFVTLKLQGELRGCIGNLTAVDSIVQAVRENAVHAAFHDPRFQPLAAQELEKVQIEVSVLTEPQQLAYDDVNELLAKLKPGIDGVILRKGSASATFLPQVWEQLPRPESFLAHLCMKAGLGAKAWRKGNLNVYTYQVQYFEEPR